MPPVVETKYRCICTFDSSGYRRPECGNPVEKPGTFCAYCRAGHPPDWLITDGKGNWRLKMPADDEVSTDDGSRL